MAVWMSSLVKKVVAIDIDTTFLQEYHEIIDIRETPIESFADIQTYDIVYARFLLSCVNPREKIILKMVESLKSGGYLVIEDFDLITLYISDYSDDEMNKLHKKIVEAYIKTMIQLGWEPHLGSTLTRMVIESKLELIINEAKVKNRIGGEPASKIWKNSIQYWSDHICQNGLLSNDEISRYIELLNDPTFTFFSPMVVQIIARKK